MITHGTDAFLQTPDGRTLAYCSVGPEDAPLVLHQHGGPDSRYGVLLLADIAQSVGVRIVGLDRPGIGKSTKQLSRSFKSWSDDLQFVATALNADVFAVTGISEGGPWALSTAYYIPQERLAHVSCMGPACYGAFGRNWAAQYLARADAFGGWLATHFPPGLSMMYAALNWYVCKFPKQYAKTIMNNVCLADQNVLKQPGAMDLFIKMSVECFRQGTEGLVIDAFLLYEKWPYDVSKIKRPVHFWQGLADTLVPSIINQKVAEKIAGAIWHPLEGEGHLLFNHPEIFQQAKSDTLAARTS